jgi:hypothetical protein
MTMYQQIVIVDDSSERTTLLAQARHDALSRIQPAIPVIGDEVVIDLKADDSAHMLQEIGIAC